MLTFLLFVVFAVTIHEWAHAAAAVRLGDDTPRLMGRLTFDPRAHIDPLGGLMFLIAGFGWGKPVIYNPIRLHRRVDELLVALAGPLVNLIAALLLNASVILLAYSVTNPGLPLTNLVSFLRLGAQVNIILAAFNFIPIPPLDGSSIIAHFWPGYRSIFASQFGLIMLILLLFIPIGGVSLIQVIMNPLTSFFNTITLGHLFI